MRRELLVIATITLLALAAIAVFGGAFRLQPVNEDLPKTGGLSTTATLPDPDSGPRASPTIRFRILEKGSGRRIEARTKIDVLMPDGRWAATALLDVQGELSAVAPLGVPLFALVRVGKADPVEVGPFTASPSPAVAIVLEFATPHWVSVTPEPRALGEITVFSDAPPSLPRAQPIFRTAAFEAGTCRLDLAPGRYWAAIPEVPTWGRLSLDCRAFVFAFEVGTEDLQLNPKVTWPSGSLRVEGRVLDRTGWPESSVVELLKFGPGPLSQVIDRSVSSQDGQFRFEGLLPGLYRARIAHSPYTESSVFDLREGEKSARIEVRPSEAPMPVTPPDAVGSVRVLRRGVPLAGARLRSGHDNFVGHVSGADGVISLRTVREERLAVGTLPVSWASGFEMSRLVAISHDSTRQLDIELAPVGTAVLRVQLSMSLAPFVTGLLLKGGDGRVGLSHLPVYPDADHTCEFYGLAPGEYQLTVLGDGGAFTNVAFRAQADAMAVAPIELSARQVAVAGLPIESATVFVLLPGETDPDVSSVWNNRVQESGEVVLPCAPTGFFRLVAIRDDRVWATADVPPGDERTQVTQWRLLYAPENEAASVVVRTKFHPASGNLPSVSLKLSAADFPAICLIRRRGFSSRGSVFEVFFESLPPGLWSVEVDPSAETHLPMRRELELAPGRIINLELELNPEFSLPRAEGPVPRSWRGVRQWQLSDVAWPKPERLAEAAPLDLSGKSHELLAQGEYFALHIAGADATALWFAEIKMIEFDRLEYPRGMRQPESRSLPLVQYMGHPLLLLSRKEFYTRCTYELRVPGFRAARIQPSGEVQTVWLDPE